MIADPSRDALEREIEAGLDRDDDIAPYRVLADLLQARGDSFGEIIALACEQEVAPRREVEERLATCMKAYLGSFQSWSWSWRGVLVWHRGFVREATLASDASEMVGYPDDRLLGLLEDPCGRFLRRLVIEQPSRPVVDVLVSVERRPPLVAIVCQRPPSEADAERLRAAYPRAARDGLG